MHLLDPLGDEYDQLGILPGEEPAIRSESRTSKQKAPAELSRPADRKEKTEALIDLYKKVDRARARLVGLEVEAELKFKREWSQATTLVDFDELDAEEAKAGDAAQGDAAAGATGAGGTNWATMTPEAKAQPAPYITPTAYT